MVYVSNSYNRTLWILLSANPLPNATSLPEKKNVKCPIVLWSGIQRSLEMAQSDVLILLDCCSSGVAHGSEGNGVTELICACPFDTKANGVGPYSFTQALTTELRFLSKKPCFSVGELYTSVYTRIQSFLPQGVENERYPPPVHFAFTQDESFPRSIILSVHDSQDTERGSPAYISPEAVSLEHAGPLNEPKKRRRLDENPSSSSKEPTPRLDGAFQKQDSCRERGGNTPVNTSNNIPEGVPKESLSPRDAPRALFAVRFKEDVRAEDLSIELFTDWLRLIPAATEEVCVEASFKCLSTLLFITVPLSMQAYIPENTAIFYLGTVLSPIMLPLKNKKAHPFKNNNERTSRSFPQVDTTASRGQEFRELGLQRALDERNTGAYWCTSESSQSVSPVRTRINSVTDISTFTADENDLHQEISRIRIGSRDKNVGWFNSNLETLTPAQLDLFENYSCIPPDRVIPHILNIVKTPPPITIYMLTFHSEKRPGSFTPYLTLDSSALSISHSRNLLSTQRFYHGLSRGPTY